LEKWSLFIKKPKPVGLVLNRLHNGLWQFALQEGAAHRTQASSGVRLPVQERQEITVGGEQV
jgi:hypothetical protein